MKESEIIKFLKENIAPVHDIVYDLGYPASTYLEDGTYLPCVIFRNTSDKKMWYSGKVINYCNIKRMEVSPFALPAHIEKMIKGETSMGYTGFTGRMKDGKIFSFGTGFETQFFAMPEGYCAADIVEIVNHSFVDQNGEMRFHRSNSNNDVKWDELKVYRELPSLVCYLDEL